MIEIYRKARNICRKHYNKGSRHVVLRSTGDRLLVSAFNGVVWYQASIPKKLDPFLKYVDPGALAKRGVFLADLKHRLSSCPIEPPNATDFPLGQIPSGVLQRLAHAMGDDGEPYKDGVMVDYGFAVATDGHQVAIETLDDPFQARLPSALVKLAVQYLPGLSTIYHNKAFISLSQEREGVTERLITGASETSFPPWRDVIHKQEIVQVSVDREWLADSAWRVAATHDIDRARLEVGNTVCKVTNNKPRQIVEFSAPAKSHGAPATGNVNGRWITEALEKLDTSHVTVRLLRDPGPVQRVQEDLERLRNRENVYATEEGLLRRIAELEARPADQIELTTGDWRTVIMPMLV